MSYLKFDKDKLVNLDYSLKREIIRTNRAGSYCSTTVIGCNTRKYHGLLVCPLDQIDSDKHVLLSSLDITVIQHDTEFHLGINKFSGDNYHPKGHKYIRELEFDKLSLIRYRVGGVVLSRETLLISNEEQLIVKLTLEEANSPTKLQVRPFLAYRNFHALSKANMWVNTKVDFIPNGISTNMYSGYPSLNMQSSKNCDFIVAPDWYYNFEYSEEQSRGYDFREDLWVPGYCEFPIKKGESVYLSFSLKEVVPSNISKIYAGELKNRIERNNFKNCLITAANQFIVHKKDKAEVTAGYPWFGAWGRDTFISLPGLTLAIDNSETFLKVVDTMVARMKNGLFPNMGSDDNPAFNSVDAPLWFFWSLQQYADYTGKPEEVWKKYSETMKSILSVYRYGGDYNIRMLDNGLIFAGTNGKALTWMDAVVHGQPVTARIGMPVEINALWYNALVFTLNLAKAAKDKKFISEWEDIPQKFEEAFILNFWDPKLGYLADYVNDQYKDWSVRPNQIIATSLEFSPLSDDIKRSVIDVVTTELLTPRGLRTLSPKDENYKGIYDGDQPTRDHAYHQGTVWPWLLGPYSRSYVKIHKKSGISFLKKIYEGFEGALTEYGVGTIAEIYNGDPPHHPKGAISQAWSVAALLEMSKIIEDYEK